MDENGGPSLQIFYAIHLDVFPIPLFDQACQQALCTVASQPCLTGPNKFPAASQHLDLVGLQANALCGQTITETLTVRWAALHKKNINVQLEAKPVEKIILI